MNRRRALLVAILTLAGIPARARYEGPGMEWYRAPEPAGGWTLLPRGRALHVQEARQAEAVELLRDVSCVVLDDAQARYFNGFPIPRQGRHLILARMVRTVRGGTVMASVRGTALAVHYGVLTRGPLRPAEKAAALIDVDALPDTVFVSFSEAS